MPKFRNTPQVEQPVVEETPVEEETPDEADIVSRLSQLGADLQAVATDRTRRQAKVREIEALLRSLKVDDFPELAESETIKTFAGLLANPKDLRPGEVKNAGTLAEVRKDWSIEDCWREGASPTFMPMESLPIIFNGVRVDIVAGEENVIPAPHYAIYQQHVRAQKNAAQTERWLSGKTDIAPDRNWMTPAHFAIRALGSVVTGVGPITLENPVSAEAEDAS